MKQYVFEYLIPFLTDFILKIGIPALVFLIFCIIFIICIAILWELIIYLIGKIINYPN